MTGPPSLLLAAEFENGEFVQAGERLTLRARVRNEGGDAPAPASLLVSAEPALVLISTSPYARRDECELRFELPALLAAEELTLGIDAYALAPGALAISLRLDAGESSAERTLVCTVDARAGFAAAANRVELFALEAEAGALVEGRLVATNTGRAAVSGCVVAVDGDLEELALAETISALAPQERRIVRLCGRVPNPVVDRTTLRVSATLRGAGGEVLLGEGEVIARSSARFDPAISRAAAEPGCLRPGTESDLAISLYNHGSDAARDLRVELEVPPWLACSPLPVAIGTLEAGASVTVHATARAIGFERRCGTIGIRLVARDLAPVALEPVPIEILVEPLFGGSISARVAGEPQPGERVEWELRFTNAGDARAGEVRVALAFAGAVYAPGSTTIDGAQLIDVHGSSPLWTAGGLVFAGVDPQTTIAIECAAIVDAGAGAATLWARILCDGREVLIESAPLAIADAVAGPPELPYAVRGARLQAGGLRAPVPRPAATGLTRSFEARLDPPALGHLASLRGLMRHLWALAVLCSDAPHVNATRIALRSVFDRLSIKLRMPHYPVGPDDVIDPAAREALAGLGIVDPRLGEKLAGAAGLIAAGEPFSEEPFANYREALAASLRELDDSPLIDALVVSCPGLDEKLDAALALEAGAVPA